MNRIRTQSAGEIPSAKFKAALKGKPIHISGKWPPSTDIQARTDIAIEMIKAGLIKYQDPGAGTAFTVGSDPLQVGPDLRMPGAALRLTWIDYDRIDNEIGAVQ